MKTFSFINLKGGVGKTTLAVNLAYILSRQKRVLIIDCDKQGNTSKFYNRHIYDTLSLSNLLTDKNCQPSDVMQDTDYPNLKIIPANMHLVSANLKIMLDMERQQQTILKNALESVQDDFDICVIDCSPDINIAVINALVASDFAVIPVKIDQWALDGLNQLSDQFAFVEQFNPDFKLLCCVSNLIASNNLTKQKLKELFELGYPVADTYISRSVKVDESTFTNRPICLRSCSSKTAKQFLKLADEIAIRAGVKEWEIWTF